MYVCLRMLAFLSLHLCLYLCILLYRPSIPPPPPLQDFAKAFQKLMELGTGLPADAPTI